MLAIEVELLTGRYAATEHNDRSRAEWPPHPARFFSALVAALHDHDPVDARERAALEWLERQGAPALDVDLSVDSRSGRRQVRPVFVPVNDVTLVGDPEAPLRAAQSALRSIEEGEDDGKPSAEGNRARKAVVTQQDRYERFMAAQRVADAVPAASALRMAAALLPDRRVRQERTFPVVVPSRCSFTLIWPDADAGDHHEAIGRLCDRVTRLGHSSSLVRCRPTDVAPAPTLVPHGDGEHVLRVVGEGQLERLETEFVRHRAVELRVLPARPQRYGSPATRERQVPASHFSGDWILFERIGGDRPLASRGTDLAVSLRRALIESHGHRDLPAALSGHADHGQPATTPHVAFVSIPWVGHPHADGAVQGIAIILPRELGEAERQGLFRLLARFETKRGDPADDFSVELGTPSDVGRPLRVRLRRVGVSAKAALNPLRWSRLARRFVSATPIALDRHPGNLRSNVDRTAHRAAAEAQRTIADACERIGLPRPAHVQLSFSPILSGSQHVRDFAPWPHQGGRTRRAKVHAEILFREPVTGPLLIGAGRYFGLGLCLPVAETREPAVGQG